MAKPPIFVLGSPRSGTSLLRLILTSHPGIAIPPECGFAVWWRPKYGDWSAGDGRLDEFVRDLQTSRKIETWGLDYRKLRHLIHAGNPASYSNLVSLVYSSYCESQGRPDARWGDKNNYYVRHVRDIRQMFPDSALVHIVRDGRDVCASYRELNRKEMKSQYAPRLPHDPFEVATEWRGNLEALRASFGALDWRGVHEMRYEDLVENPRKATIQLCEFLGEEFDQRMLMYFSPANSANHEPDEFLEWKNLTREPPTGRQVGRFRRDLTSGQIAEFESAAGPLLAQYGYV